MELATLNLDTYKVVQLLQEKGYDKSQAEGFIDALREITLSGVATKQNIEDLKEDIKDLKDSTKQDIQGVKNDITEFKAGIGRKIDAIKIWFLGAMLTQTIALMAFILNT